MARRKRKLSKKEVKALKKQDAFVQIKPVQELKPEVRHELKIAEIPQVLTVREFAAILALPISEVIGALMKNGVSATINESIDFDTASIIADELGYELKRKELTQELDRSKVLPEEAKKLLPRPPVVVVLGHVDHGKTTLLDKIRETNVAGGEAGGITQHIGAYQVKVKTKNEKGKSIDKIVTFLDTPGHEAFSAMRAHGANITDVAILVVAADDGVKPQTKEAISHAKAANIPIIVAINKIDKPEADIEKVKRELADLELIAEEWGGKTVMMPISAKTGKNISELLEMVLITTELLELKANPNKPAKGVVIESHMQLGMGPLATILIQDGTLNIKDVVVVGHTYGKIKRIEDYQGKILELAGPSTPVRIAGLHEMPNFGDIVETVKNEKEAFTKTQAKKLRFHHFGLAEVSEKIKSGETQELPLIIKADTQGSLEAIKTVLNGLSNDNVSIKIVHQAVGDVNESDINLAITSQTIVLGFNVKTTSAAKNLAKAHGVKIATYSIIYNLIDDISSAVAGMLATEITEVVMGKLEVLKVFKSTKNHKIIGGTVIDGKIANGSQIYIYHSQEKLGQGKIVSLEVNKQSVSEVAKGHLCGLAIDSSVAIKAKDLIEAYTEEESVKKIVDSRSN